MEGAANPLDDPADATALERYAAALADAVVTALPGWVRRVVDERYRAASGEELPAPVEEAVRAAGQAVVADVEGPLRALLAQDVDEQRTNPLSVIRGAVHHPTQVLLAAGVPPVRRDPHAERLFPDDVYDLAPAAFADLDPSVHEPGLVWGAAKAHVVMSRRRRSAPPTSSEP